MLKRIRDVAVRQFIVAMVSMPLLLSTELTKAQPWLDTSDTQLRVDIDRLSGAGVISVPVNTWPLMWSGIVSNLDAVDIGHYSLDIQQSFARVLSAGQKAQDRRPQHSVKLAVATDSQLLRHFGDTAREQLAFSVQRQGSTDHLAYNLEITSIKDPWDQDTTVYDNSYFGLVLGNWIVLAGNVEKWWGPGWNSNLILSNNARPAPGLSLQRNYSDPFKHPVIKWLGPWTTNIFISQLDDDRAVDSAKLIGMTLGFRPYQPLEINLRRTAQWGGDGRPQGFSNFLELVTGIADNCETATCRTQEPGNQLAGIDLRWHLPWAGTSVYAQTLGEDEAGGLPSKRAFQLGAQVNVDAFWLTGLAFIEYDDTSTSSSERKYNLLYNHSIYTTGYRYQGRGIGATWDNDSAVTSIGFLGALTNGDQIEARYSYGEINSDSIDGSPSLHSITTVGGKFKTALAKWQRPFYWGRLEIEGRYTDRLLDDFGRQEERLRLGASVIFHFD